MFSVESMARAIYLVVFFLMPAIYATLNNNCRTIQFEPVTKDKILKNHVIRNISVQSQSQCQSNCFQEPNCVSYNYGPLHSDTPTCELSNRTHLQVSSSDFLQKREYIHQHIKNSCEGSPCPSNTLCQAGFTNRGYRCICVNGLEQGANCNEAMSALLSPSSAFLSSSSSPSSSSPSSFPSSSLSSSSSSPSSSSSSPSSPSSSSSSSSSPSSWSLMSSTTSSLSSSSLSTSSPPSPTPTSTFLSSSSSQSPSLPSSQSSRSSPMLPSPSADISPDPTPLACSEDWRSFQSSCYHLTTDGKSWNIAKLKCFNSGAQLVKIDSSEENDFIKTTFLADGADYWIGLTDEETEGSWKWSGGSILEGFQKWHQSQPTGTTSQNCGGIRMGSFQPGNFDAEWHDRSCEEIRGYICEK